MHLNPQAVSKPAAWSAIATLEPVHADQSPSAFPVRTRIILAAAFVGAALVVIGALLAGLFQQTTPITDVMHIHKGAIGHVEKTDD